MEVVKTDTTKQEPAKKVERTIDDVNQEFANASFEVGSLFFQINELQEQIKKLHLKQHNLKIEGMKFFEKQQKASAAAAAAATTTTTPETSA